MLDRILRLLCAFLFSSSLAEATVVSTGAVPHPVNLGPAADPGRIPIGSVPCESNHGFGVHALISAPLPLVHGGWRWEGGIELNGNLPSAFGISVEPADPTIVPGEPVTIRVRKQAPPAYSPHTKEQVLLATMRCLLDSVSATTRRPLTIEVVTEDPADEDLRSFSGEYVTQALEDEDLGPTPLPGCRTKVDEHGARWVVFEGVEPTGEREQPVWMPFPIEGDSEQGCLLLPVWPGNLLEGDRLELLGRPWPVLQDLFNPASGGPDANLLTRRDRFGTFKVTRDAEGVAIHAYVPSVEDEAAARDLALLCWAAVLSEIPTAERPLQIELRVHGATGETFQEWVDDAGWEQFEIGGDQALRGRFVWDASEHRLLSGRIPILEVVPGANGGWDVVDVGTLPEKPESRNLPGVKESPD